MVVLQAEDDTLVRLTLADFFEDAGLDFLEASNAEDALVITDDPSQHVDVLVTGFDLGVGDSGLGLAAKARQRQPKLRVVYETDNPEMLVGRTFSASERVFYKPFDPLTPAPTVSALNSPRRSGQRDRRPSARLTVASSL